MKCSDVQELFADYFDMTDGDLHKQAIDGHVARCPVCREQLELWTESAKLIQTDRIVPDLHMRSNLIADGVMNRIYRDESWRRPVATRIYAIPYKMRRNVTAVIAFCIALFAGSFLYMWMGSGSEEVVPTKYGFHQAASASNTVQTASLSARSMSSSTVASASGFIEPIKIASIHYTPNYLLALSLLGFTSTLLIMNWLSRTRS
ncbi:anti-sigma factor family protein [Paenibacillus cymbidii]|uniref:anti-sigma factor family protein n=1 Tax=Paenibacillus cymbidii TaxID=1639034 RepID=UPI001081C024|nr:zf-HC2 domain-containing protein [Paenibacillus cymbidii]